MSEHDQPTSADGTEQSPIQPASDGHEPVLLRQVRDLLQPATGETIVDCTIGRAGHARAMLEAALHQSHASTATSDGTDSTSSQHASISPTSLVGFDLDPANIAHAERALANFAAPSVETEPPATVRSAMCRIVLTHGNFLNLPRVLADHELRADVILADLGFASSQMDDPARGLSFRADAPLDMRLDPTSNAPTAADLLRTLSETELADLIFHVGEDPLARRIARKVAQQRATRPIQSTLELADLVRTAYGARARSSRVHPATRTFMALRIAVNCELEALDGLLAMIEREAEILAVGESGTWLNPGARIGIISFHSHEDRRVKQAFRQWKKRGMATVLTKRPVVADEQEVRRNPRSRSAKLRAVRIDGPSQRQSDT